MTHPIIIIGSGMAGYTLARELRKQNQEQSLIMISADDAQNYAKPTLSNAFATKKQPEKIALAQAEKMAAQLNMHIEKHATVEKIDAEKHEIYYVKDNQTVTLTYSKLVLAVGATAIQPDIFKNQSAVYRVNSLQDYITFRSFIDTNAEKRIAIVGGGLIGCEFAHDLQQSGHHVTVIEKNNYLLKGLLPENIAHAFQERLSSLGIQFMCDTTVTDIQAEYLTTNKNDQVKYDAVLCAIGLQPNTALAKVAGIESNRGIKTNTLLETNQPHIYAMGDCLEINGLVLPYVMPIMQQAKALAKTLSGIPTHLHYPAMPIAIKTPTAPLTVLPPQSPIGLTWTNEILEDGIIAKAFDSENNLSGFILLGATAAKQRMALTKLVPDWIPPQIEKQLS